MANGLGLTRLNIDAPTRYSQKQLLGIAFRWKAKQTVKQLSNQSITFLFGSRM